MSKVGRRWDPRVRLLVAGAVLLLIGVSAGAYLLRDHPRNCGGPPLSVTVAAAPDIAPALGRIAARFNLQTHEMGGRCVQVVIAVRDPAQVAQALESGRPAADAWVPDSSLWLDRVRAARPSAVGVGTSVAASPVVIAAPRTVAAELRKRKGGFSWQVLKNPPLNAVVRALDPARNAAGALTTLAARPAVGATPIRREPDPARLFAAFAGLPGLRRPIVVAAEVSVIAYNDTHRPNPATVIVPVEGTILLDHPLTTTTADPARAEAVDAFRSALRSRQATGVLQWYGLRMPDGRFDPEYAGRLGLPPSLPKILPRPDPSRAAFHAGTPGRPT